MKKGEEKVKKVPFTDLEKLSDLCEKFGIEFTVDDSLLSDHRDSVPIEERPLVKTVRTGCGNGYYGYFAEFYFDQETGRFVNYGVWK